MRCDNTTPAHKAKSREKIFHKIFFVQSGERLVMHSLHIPPCRAWRAKGEGGVAAASGTFLSWMRRVGAVCCPALTFLVLNGTTRPASTLYLVVVRARP